MWVEQDLGRMSQIQFSQIKSEMPIRHPSGNVELLKTYLSLELMRWVQADDAL